MGAGYWSKVSKRRLSRRRALAAAGAAALGAALSAACGEDDRGDEGQGGLLAPVVDETANVKRGGAIKAKAPSDVLDFDPHIFPNAHSVCAFVYGGLFALKDGYLQYATGELIPDVAESYELSPDKLTLTAKTNPNAHFPPQPPVNGRSVDARDVAASWTRFKQLGSQRAEFASDVNPAAPIVSVTAPDNRTVVIKMKEPNSTIGALLARQTAGSFFIVPKEAMDPRVADVKRMTLGTGPFYVSDYAAGAGYTMKRNPAFQQFKGDLPYVDEISWFIVPEYAIFLAQFRLGALHIGGSFTSPLTTAIRAPDILLTKQALPALLMFETYWTSAAQRLYLSQLPDSPFRDERVRQAYVLTWDRDAHLETVFNVRRFQQAGVPVKTVAESALPAGVWSGWFVDPRSREFGPNAKHFGRDVDAANQLLAAAGHPKGIDTVMTTPLQEGATPAGLYNGLEALIAMTQDTGLFRFRRQTVGFAAEWVPRWQNARGQFSGVGIGPPAPAADPVQYLFAHYHPAGAYLQGTDPTLQDLTLKAVREFDWKRRLELAQDAQRYEGGKLFFPKIGAATGLSLSWPNVRNQNVYQGGSGQTWATLFVDPDQPPLNSAT